MLYDPKWEVESETNLLSLAAFIHWLEKQDPATKYDWEDCRGGCLVGRYYISVFGPDIFSRRRPPLSAVFGGSWGPLPPEVASLYKEVAGTEPYTYGAALDRAREAVKGDA